MKFMKYKTLNFLLSYCLYKNMERDTFEKPFNYFHITSFKRKLKT